MNTICSFQNKSKAKPIVIHHLYARHTSQSKNGANEETREHLTSKDIEKLLFVLSSEDPYTKTAPQTDRCSVDRGVQQNRDGIYARATLSSRTDVSNGTLNVCLKSRCSRRYNVPIIAIELNYTTRYRIESFVHSH